MLILKNISFSYGKNQILKDINLSFKQGEKVTLIAPSGYGKSTLAKIITGYETQDSGEIFLNDQKIKKNRYSPIQLIHQNPELSLNPKLNILKHLKESGVCLNEGFFDFFDIKKEWLYKFPDELSGGEKQKICIARALNEETKFIVADEITSMLDSVNQAKVWKYLLHLVSKHHVGLISITHDINLAKKISDKIIELEKINNI